MVDVIIAVAAKVAELLVVPIGKHIIYPVKYKSNMEELAKQVEKLTNRRDTVQHSVDEAKRQGDEIEKHVEKWMNSVDEFTNGVVKPIIDDQVKVGKLCSIGFCPNLMARYSLSRKAAKTTEKGIDLLGQGNFDKVSYRPPLEKTPSIFIRGYEDFDSRKEKFTDLMEALRNADVNLIGVYGMGGVGKTTLVKRVVGQAIQDKLFDDVVMAEVTETPDIKKIQGQIADELGLKLEEEGLPGRAARLRDRLKKVKRLLLVLDNIWAKLDLEAVGIPLGKEEEKRSSLQADQKGRKDEQRQGKILFTSRNLDVLRDDMNTQKNFFIEILSVEEAEKLFWKIVGHSEEKPDLNPIAVKIVEKCAGLPVAIATIASALKNKSLPVWNNALEQLRTSNPRNIKGMDKNVYSAIELSYNFLEGEEAKSLFLLCGLMAASGLIRNHELFKYAIGWGLFQDVHTMEQGRNKLHTLIDSLQASCLLLENNYGNYSMIKMHDIIHAVAVSIASTKKLMFNIGTVTCLKEMLEEKLPRDAIAVSLPYGQEDIRELPERLELPKLKLLYLSKKDLNLLQISDTFFEGVKELKVLDLTRFHLSSLPSSLQLLTNLQTLCLCYCTLGDIASIGYLTKLEVLSLTDSNIKQLPEEIGQLKRLRYLDMSQCIKLKTITPGVISSLTRLEELYMGGFVQWDVNEQMTNASLTELKQLAHLTALSIRILDVHVIPQDLFSWKLDRHIIFIGDAWRWFSNYSKTSKTLKLKWSNIIYLGNGIKSLLNRTEDLCLDELKGVKNILYELDEEGFPQLKHLRVQNGLEVQDIISSDRLGPSTFFPKLESLFLHNLINLEKICNCQLAIESFSKLRIVKVEKCDRLKHLFSFSMVKNLLQLEEIEAIDCKKLEEIVFNNSDTQFHQNGRTEFTRLRTLRLQCLPQLTSFGFNAFTPEIGSQEIVAEDELCGFMASFSQNVLLPNLETLELSSINIQCLWLDQLPVMSSCCRTLTSLTLEECSGNLKFLFSYSVVQSLVQLQKLKIRNCKSIEGVINSEEPRGEGKAIKMVFPKLINLQLEGLPKLSRFGSGNSVEFLSLIQISIQDCPKLKTFFFDVKKSKEFEDMNFKDDIHLLFDEKVVLPNLASMNLSSIRIKTIWHNQLQPMSSCFQNLKRISMDGCDTLKYVFSSSIVEVLIQLEVLEISNCKAMEVVTITAGERISNTWFPKLYRLVLKRLPKLTTFCNVAGKSIELTSLAELWLENCPKMFAQHADMPAAKEEQKNSEKNLQYSHIQPFFDEKVQLPSLASLYLYYSIASQTIWHNQLQAHSACFHNLTKFIVIGCDNLKYLFPFSVAESLNHLEYLYIQNCKLMEGVIITQGERKSSTLIPKLKKLNLDDLPELTRFCNFSGNSIELPSLSELNIQDCPKMQTFASDSLPGIEETEEVNTETEENLPSFFDEKVSFSCLKKLELRYLPELLHLWKENSKPRKVLENLAYLEVSGCNNLKTLVPSSVSLHNLETLEVRNCDGLISLVTFSTAKSLKQLKRMEIIYCKLVEEIIIDRGDEIKDVIVFNQLEYLKLQELPSLTSFCKESFTIEFPYLQRVLVIGCLKMMNFSQGVLSTPKLQSVQMAESIDERKWKFKGPEEFWEGEEDKEDEGCWEGDLNATVQKLFRDEVGLRYIENFTVSKFPHLKEVWHEKIRGSCFSNLKSLVVDDKCFNLRYIFTPSMALGLAQLQDLEIKNCVIMEVITIIGEETISNTMFPNLNSLELIDLPNLTCFCNFAGNSIELPSLTRLSIENCPKMETFISNFLGVDMSTSNDNCHTDIKPLFDEKVQLPTLASLYLFSIASQTISWHNQLKALSACFHNLTKLTIQDCHNLKYLFPFSVAESLDNLEVLDIWSCDLIEGVIITQGERKSSTPFPKLKQLDLCFLPELTRFCNFNGNSIELPSLSELKIWNCTKMQTFASNSLPGIEEPEEVNTDTEENLPSFFDEKVSFSCLKKLELSYLPELLHLWKENSQPRKVFENLAYLEVSSCDNLKTLVPSSVSLQNLETLEVRYCDGLISLMTFSTAKSLEQLKRMEIFDCKLIEEIIIDTGDEINDGIVFNQLEYLKLQDLPSLTSFCKGSFTIEFPYLQRVLVIGCLKMMNFSQGVLSTPKLQSLQMTESSDEGCWEGDLDTTIQKLFRDGVGFRYIENFTVSNFPHLKEVWHEKFLVSYFSNLKSLVVDDKCCSLRNIFTPSVALGLAQLQYLEIKNCVILEVITVIGEETISNTMFPNLNSLKLINLPNLTCFYNFAGNSIELPSLTQLSIENCPKMETFISNFRGVDMSTSKDNCHTDIQPLFDEKASSCGKTQAITATQLKYLELKDLPKLKHIWDVDSQGLLTCQNLISIEVTGCGSLKSIFPASVGRNLFQLEELCIENCCTVEEIFAKEEQVDEAGPQFPQLFNLRLAELPRLRSFYPRVHISEWPMLKELQVWNCDKVEVSASKFLSFQVTHEMPLDQPLLLLDKVPLTNLESLGLDWKWFEKEELHEKLPEYSCKLNFLTIEGFRKGADICVFCFLHKLPNLDKLQVSGGFFKGLFLCEGFGCEEKHVEAPTKLSHLRLLKLNDSLHLWEENSLSSKGFQNLAILEVDCCSNIKSLVPSAVSFQNLTRLEVLKCNKLLNLMAIPTAKSLVQLTELSISECKMVEEIIIHEEDEVKDQIVFKKLRNLELKCLPNLTSFYSGSYTIVFPYLQQVVVSECLNMKIFSRGVLSTPRLHRLQTTEEEDNGFWKGNLNTTIEHLFIENGQSCTEN